jgi:hypothetical protein
MKVLNPFNYEVSKGKVITQKSQTIPDQTMSIRTILDRYAKGLPVTGYKNPIYEDSDIDEVIQDPRKMDLAERQQFAKYAKEQSENIIRQYGKQTPTNNGGGDSKPSKERSEAE